jgi:predicted transposase YdaD
MLDFDKATKILTEHFANLTPEQFEVNLREYCPELFPETVEPLDRSLLMKDTDIYQQAQQDNKLQIVPKLLNKGLSIQEVAELLELDTHKVEETAVAHGIQV